jgi:predicted RNase H-like HicB family nuclease
MKTDMRYPLYVWKDEGSAYSASFPDLPDVFTAADELVDLPSMAQEAVMVMYGSSDAVLPEPSTIEQWEADKQFQGGFWMQVLIQLPA